MVWTNFLHYKTIRNKTYLCIKELVLNLIHVATKSSNIPLDYYKKKSNHILKMSAFLYKTYILQYTTLEYTTKILISLRNRLLNYYRQTSTFLKGHDMGGGVSEIIYRINIGHQIYFVQDVETNRIDMFNKAFFICSGKS